MLAGNMAVRRASKVSRREARMIVRIASVQVVPDLIDAIVSRYRETVRPIHQQAQGLRNHYVLVDRHSGRMRLIGVWDSQEALDAAIPTLEPARERLWSGFEVTPSLKAYEVADRI
jgi:quinol monooxygenase YgiN